MSMVKSYFSKTVFNIVKTFCSLILPMVCILLPALGALQMLVKICLFTFFAWKMPKRTKQRKNAAKNVLLGLAPKRWLRVLFPEKIHFVLFFLGICDGKLGFYNFGCWPLDWSIVSSIHRVSLNGVVYLDRLSGAQYHISQPAKGYSSYTHILSR